VSRPTRSSPAGRAYLDLQNRARKEGRGTQELLTLYVVERWLARLARSPYVEDFVLKGGMLLAAFGQRRPTVDADALARNMPGDERAVAARVAAIAELPDPDDGVVFDTATITTRVIRDEALYSGLRVVMDAQLASATVKLRLDVNFGDPITPAPQVVELPALRAGSPPVRVLGYPIETVLAEKIATAIDLGPANTRVRDYADIHVLVSTRDLEHGPVRAALVETCRFRATTIAPLSAVIGDFVELRTRAYAAYRAGLGPYGVALPASCSALIESAVTFADQLAVEEPEAACWSASSGRWEPGS
jgi:hypothetical protein